MCFGLSSLLRRSSFGIALGLVVLLYALGLFVNLDAGLEPLKFLTPYYYADAARVFSGEAVRWRRPCRSSPAAPWAWAGAPWGCGGTDERTLPPERPCLCGNSPFFIGKAGNFIFLPRTPLSALTNWPAWSKMQRCQ